MYLFFMLNSLRFQSFPLPGEFQYRVFKSINSSLNVWLDLSDDNDILMPLSDGTVLIKCSRIGGSNGAAALSSSSSTTTATSSSSSSSPPSFVSLPSNSSGRGAGFGAAKANPFAVDDSSGVASSSSELSRFVVISLIDVNYYNLTLFYLHLHI